MRKLSKYEKETIINWNEGENIASIYTFNASLKRREYAKEHGFQVIQTEEKIA